MNNFRNPQGTFIYFLCFGLILLVLSMCAETLWAQNPISISSIATRIDSSVIVVDVMNLQPNQKELNMDLP